MADVKRRDLIDNHAALNAKHWLALVAVLLGGCGAKDDIPGRLPTYAVTGEVFVDGQPAADAFVYLNPRGDRPPQLRPYAQVDSQGKFAISTYLAGDGAPAGEYVITIEWLTYQQFSNQWSGPDKLNGQYARAEDSTFKASVHESALHLPRIDLAIQNPDAK